MEIKTVFFHDKDSSFERKDNKHLSKTAVLPVDASLKDKIIAAIRTVYDPEIHVNIYDLGLIYQIIIEHDTDVIIKMTLTAPACPVAEILPRQVADAIKLVEGVSEVNVDLVWEPSWNRECISDEAKLSLGLF